MEVKDLKLSALKPPPPNPFSSSSVQPKPPSSFFDQPNSTSAGEPFPNPPASVPFHKPPAMPLLASAPAKSPVAQIMPPLVQPPASLPPPPSAPNPTGGSSNPYAAKGALNKKVYDKGTISVAPIAPPANFLAQPASHFAQPPVVQSASPTPPSSSQSAQSLFMPVTAATQPPAMPTSQSYQFPSQPM